MSADAALARLEARVLGMGGLARWLGTVDELRKLLAMGDPDIARLVLALSTPDVEAQALAAVLDAYTAGLDDALRIIDREGIEVRELRRGRPSREARELVHGLDREARDAMDTARRLIYTGADIDAVLAPIFGYATSMRRRVSDGITRAGNEGSTAVADAAKLPTVWVAEVNACVTCLAYSGRTADPGDDFPAGLTYGRRSSVTEPVGFPPAHPHCRCTVEPLNDPSYAAALRREADRSVLRGFSLESESMATRIDAAERLLNRGVTAPKSVLAYARAAVKRGEFTTRGRPE
jgi:hypothetical protein